MVSLGQSETVKNGSRHAKLSGEAWRLEIKPVISNDYGRISHSKHHDCDRLKEDFKQN
ncbi:hypothetical protein C7212DRAFT_320391 [Tuber magnatum]|uniref:Uncharacterized protein n=1 Tax=Tuber magnatum TaxID=42249 RepID=A0A317SNL8_9PEZI|nr:hypothetical protein C7212DRAFT_320391 [Tuber magnatum]